MFHWWIKIGTSYAGVGRRRMRSVSCALVECVDGFVWIVISGFWCTSAGFYASIGIKRCCRVSLREGRYMISFGFCSKTRKQLSCTIGCLVTAQTSQIKMACTALASLISLYFQIIMQHFISYIFDSARTAFIFFWYVRSFVIYHFKSFYFL